MSHRLPRIGAVVAAGSLVALGPAVAAQAAVTNPGFESGITGWAALSGTTLASISDPGPQQITGNHVAAVARKSTSGTGSAGISDSPNQFSPVAAGAVCTATAWVKGTQGRTVELRWVALNGTSSVLTRKSTVTFTGGWQQLPATTLTMPSTASTADLRFIAPSFPVGDTWYLDDVDASCGATTEPPPSNPPPGVAGHWALDEVGSPPAGAIDDSGHHNDGTNFNVVGSGPGDAGGYFFDGTNARVVVKDSASLDPVGADFSFGVTMVMDTAPAVGETYDVLRKGITTTAGGDYKLEVARTSGGLAVARCVVKDAQKVAAIIRAGTTGLADGVPHTVECHRVGNTVEVWVDNVKKGFKTVAVLGTVSNAADLAIGAKAETTSVTSGFDWFFGSVTDAFVRIDS